VPGGSAHRLGLRDAGATVRMAVGDRLVVELSNNRPAARWTVADHPRDVLVSDLDSAAVGGFTFLARGPGTGALVFTRASCGVAGHRALPEQRPRRRHHLDGDRPGAVTGATGGRGCAAWPCRAPRG
jgi:hypothetical protein